MPTLLLTGLFTCWELIQLSPLKSNRHEASKKEVKMIRISMTILFALLLIITAGNAISAEMAKEGSGANDLNTVILL